MADVSSLLKILMWFFGLLVFDDLNWVYGVSVDCMLFGVVSEVWVKEISGD